MNGTTNLLVLLAVVGVVAAGSSAFAAGNATTTELDDPGPIDECIVFCEELRGLVDGITAT